MSLRSNLQCSRAWDNLKAGFAFCVWRIHCIVHLFSLVNLPLILPSSPLHLSLVSEARRQAPESCRVQIDESRDAARRAREVREHTAQSSEAPGEAARGERRPRSRSGRGPPRPSRVTGHGRRVRSLRPAAGCSTRAKNTTSTDVAT